jgi:predicted dehydrogenase
MQQDTRTYRVDHRLWPDGGHHYEEKRSGPAGCLNHRPRSAYRQVCRTDLVAAADMNRNALKPSPVSWGVDHLYGDYRKMLAEEALDIVNVALCSLTSR